MEEVHTVIGGKRVDRLAPGQDDYHCSLCCSGGDDDDVWK